MKRKFLVLFLIFASIFVCFGVKTDVDTIYAQNNVTVLESSDYRLKSDYLNFYSVTSSNFTFSNNGGELSGNELSKAFDRNYSTSFKSAQDNNVSYIDPETNQSKPNFINVIDVSFKKAITLNRIIYASENGTTRGYPTELNLYYNNGNGYELIDNFISTPSTNFVIFDFGKSIEMQKFRFEYVKVTTSHKYIATAKEIIFLQPENDLFEIYQNLFTDYTQTTLNEKCNTYELVCEYENKLKQNINFENISLNLERAKQVALGKIVFNPKREFSTKKDAQNSIFQYGDIASYCRNNLQMSSFGTNRQVTGILSTPNTVITIYVEAGEDDPLPKIRFSQHMGSWRKWLGGELQLQLGVNTFTTPNFKHTDYTVDVALGGPIYLCNPYTNLTQSENVKVYIEGGEFYPVLREDTNENRYKFELSEYSKLVEDDPENIVDLTEIVTDHAIITVDATKANELYKNYSPNLAVTNWNSYMDKLLEFGGVTQDETNPIFDERNLHVNFNIRLVQPWAGAAAFAYTEHVGVYKSWQGALILGSGFGWGVSHEIGHMVDNVNRTIGETTNNMYAKYNETALEKANSRGEFSKTLETLSNDLTFNDTEYFNSNRYNFLIWWYIECWHKGYWGDLENCYRGINLTLQQFINNDEELKAKIASLTKTEKQVFYSSIVTGIDMSYYFDRWGYSVTNNAETDPVFKIIDASSEFKELINKAVSAGFVDNSKQYKLWYQTNTAYHNTNQTPAYSSSTVVSIKNVSKTSAGYNIFINHEYNENHLGYEILEGDDENGYKVIGFTYGSSFLEETIYDDGYNPSYKIVAIDNTFNSSKISEKKQVEENTDVVCKIGDTSYSSLLSAVESASDNDVILMVKSTTSVNLTITKNLTITLLDGVSTDVVISKIEAGNFITISSGVTLKLIGFENYKLILNGNNFSQSGSLLSVAGVVKSQYVIFENNFSTNNGGAVLMQGNSKNSTFENCIFRNNIAKNGSVFYCDFANSNAVFSNCSVLNNTSTQDGIIANKGNLTLNYCEIKNNISQTGTIKNYAGGILNVDNCVVSGNTAKFGAGFHIDGYTNIKNSQILNNIASEHGGGVYYSTNVAVRKLIIENTNFENNNSKSGKDIVILSGKLTLKSTNFITNSEINILGGEVEVSSNSNINSVINIKYGANLVLNGNLFQNFENCTFKFIDFKSGMKVLSCLNYNLTEQDCKNVKVDSDKLALQLEENTIFAFSNNITLTLNINGVVKVYNYNYGDSVVLNFDEFQQEYASKFIDENGNTYLFNETLILFKDITLTAQISNKIKIMFDDNGNIQTNYYLPNSEFVLPNINKTGNNKVIGWENNDELYFVGQKSIALKDTTYNAVFERYLKLVLIDNNEIIFEDYYEYGTKIDLSKLSKVENLNYWSLNGEKIKNSLVITGDTTLIAKHKPDNLAIYVGITFAVMIYISLILYIALKKRRLTRKKNN